jgi:hypothetical protein
VGIQWRWLGPPKAWREEQAEPVAKVNLAAPNIIRLNLSRENYSEWLDRLGALMDRINAAWYASKLLGHRLGYRSSDAILYISPPAECGVAIRVGT